MNENEIAKIIVNAAFNVHKKLGPGLLESTYEACLFYELELADLAVSSQVALPVIYKDVYLECGYRIDLLVNESLIVEIKAVQELIISTWLKPLPISNYQIANSRYSSTST